MLTRLLRRLSQRKWLLSALLLILVTTIYWYISSSRPSELENLTTITPSYQSLASTLEVSGKISADKHAILSFPTISRLSWVGAKEGDKVRQWQAIASVDTRTLQKQLEQDFNLFEKAWRSHDQTLDDTDFYSESGLTDEFKRLAEISHFDLENAALNVELRDLAIRLSSLVSPIDGVIIRMDKSDPGVTVSPTDVIEIVDPSTITFNVVIDEEEIAMVNTGSDVTITIDAFPDLAITSQVRHIDFSPTLSDTGGTGYEVTIDLPLDNENLDYRLGMNGTATIVLDRVPHALAIPSEALIYRDNQAFVDVLRGDVIERLPVVTGLETSDETQIIEGLNESDLVVVPDGTSS